MKNPITILVGLVILVIFLTRMFTFTVPYDQVVVLTTFDSAQAPEYDENGEVIPGKEGDLIQEKGLHFKLPWPIQKEYNYSTKLQLLEDQIEEIGTLDQHTVTVQTYMTWRIVEPYSFFRSLKDTDTAEKRLKPLLRAVGSVISQHRFDELVNQDPSKLKLDEIEKQAVVKLTAELKSIDPGYGIQIEQIGIRRLLLPQATTTGVFERMKTTREALAEKARSAGTSRAATIRSDAENIERTILAFANRRADAIRAQGDREAAQLYKVYEEDPEFALFLQDLHAARAIFGPETTTWIIDPIRFRPLETLLGLGEDAAQPTAARPGASLIVGDQLQNQRIEQGITNTTTNGAVK